MNKSMQRAQLALDKAAEQMAAAKAENRQEFRIKLVALCNEHGFYIEPEQGSELLILELDPIQSFKVEMLPE